MARITKSDLEHFTSDEIRNIYNNKNISSLPTPIYEYVENGEEYTKYNRLNRVINLLNIIIVERFINETL